MEENKELDDFIRKTIKEVGLEKPAHDFTDSVLSKIEKASQQTPMVVAKPLFSKLVWFFIVSGVLSIFGYVIFNSSGAEKTWLAAIQLNKLTSFNLSMNMPELNYSTTFLTSFSVSF